MQSSTKCGPRGGPPNTTPAHTHTCTCMRAGPQGLRVLPNGGGIPTTAKMTTSYAFTQSPYHTQSRVGLALDESAAIGVLMLQRSVNGHRRVVWCINAQQASTSLPHVPSTCTLLRPSAYPNKARYRKARSRQHARMMHHAMKEAYPDV